MPRARKPPEETSTALIDALLSAKPSGQQLVIMHPRTYEQITGQEAKNSDAGRGPVILVGDDAGLYELKSPEREAAIEYIFGDVEE